MNTRSLVLVTFSLASVGCAPDALVDAPELAADDVRLRGLLDATSGAQLVGASDDGRFVAYGAACDAGDARTELRLRDDATGRVRTLARGWSCLPGAVRFSPDGSLAVFGVDGALRAADTRSGRVVTVSREGLSGIGVVFSPDSRWFAVASLGDPTAGATLDAWEANLSTRVEVARGAFANPFGGGDAGLRVSPDGRALLFVGSVASPLPVGALTLWSHRERASRVVATGVPANAYAVTDDWRRVAAVEGVRPGDGAPTPDALAGDLVVRDLATGRAQGIERTVTVSSVEFARGGAAVVYVTGGFPPGTPATLKACAVGARPVTLDAEVFPMFAPARSVVVSPAGDAVAYAAAVDPARFVGDLRLARVPTTSTGSASVTVAREVVPGAFGYTRGGSLVHLHTPTATFPVAVGTLSAWSPVTRATTRLGAGVAQVGTRIDAARDEVLFTSEYDVAQAAGTLRVWNGRTTRTLAAHAAVMSWQQSPDGSRIAFLTVADAPLGEVPTVTLRVAHTRDDAPTVAVAEAVTSHRVSDAGLVRYTTDAGLFGAYAR